MPKQEKIVWGNARVMKIDMSCPRTSPGTAVLAVVCLLFGMPALAAGNLTKRAERLPELALNGASGFSVKEYRLETGKYYRWRIVSDGREEYKLLAPEFFRNSWIDQVSIEDKEVKTMGLYAVEFDDDGEIDIWLVPIRPGTYEYYVEGLQSQGFTGRFIVE